MSAEDLEKYETEMELQLYREYKDIVGQFSFVVETERRFYLTNDVQVVPRNGDGEVYFEVTMRDAWVWDMYRPARFVKNVRVLTFKDVNVEELEKPDLDLSGKGPFGACLGAPPGGALRLPLSTAGTVIHIRRGERPTPDRTGRLGSCNS